MGFVKSPQALARIEATLAGPRFGGAQLLSVEFDEDALVGEDSALRRRGGVVRARDIYPALVW